MPKKRIIKIGDIEADLVEMDMVVSDDKVGKLSLQFRINGVNLDELIAIFNEQKILDIEGHSWLPGGLVYSKEIKNDVFLIHCALTKV